MPPGFDVEVDALIDAGLYRTRFQCPKRKTGRHVELGQRIRRMTDGGGHFGDAFAESFKFFQFERLGFFCSAGNIPVEV